MKLHELLNSFLGKELTADNIKLISSQVDEIKTNAVAKEIVKYKDYDEIKKKLGQLETEKEKIDFLNDWKKAGGKPDVKLDDYNFDNYKKKDGTTDFNNFLKTHPYLKQAQKDENDKNDIIPSPNTNLGDITSITGQQNDEPKNTNNNTPEIVVY